jgi:hypothetical protein
MDDREDSNIENKLYCLTLCKNIPLQNMKSVVVQWIITMKLSWKTRCLNMPCYSAST